MPLRRAARSLSLRPNPLRRRVDLVEAWLTVSLLVALVVAGPLLALYAGTRTYAGGQRTAKLAEQGHHRVEAILLEDTASYTPAANFTTTADQLRVRARWSGPDATVREERVVTTARGRTGSVIPIWIDDDGNPVLPPPGQQQVIERAIGIGFSSLMGVVFLVTGSGLVARHLLHRRRMAYWDGAWASVEPQWSGRR